MREGKKQKLFICYSKYKKPFKSKPQAIQQLQGNKDNQEILQSLTDNEKLLQQFRNQVTKAKEKEKNAIKIENEKILSTIKKRESKKEKIEKQSPKTIRHKSEASVLENQNAKMWRMRQVKYHGRSVFDRIELMRMGKKNKY